VTSPRRSIDSFTKSAALCLGLAALLLGLSAVPASAAPSFGVQVIRDETIFPEYPVIHHGDQRTDYTVKVTNNAPASFEVGAELYCNGIEEIEENTVGQPKSWNPTSFDASDFTIEWRRNGVAIPGTGGTAPASLTYTAAAADAGKVIQCLVKGTNTIAATKYASQPGAVIDPAPAAAPPAPSNPKVGTARPAVTGSGAGMRTCSTAAMNWAGSPSFTFQWLANGEEIPDATGSTYTPVAGDAGKNIQCMVLGTNAGGTLVGISGGSPVNVEGAPNLGENDMPEVGTNVTSGPVTVELELPGGLETFARRITPASITSTDSGIPPTTTNGWSCSTQPATGVQPAKATCTRSDVLVSGASYPQIVVQAALGDDAPDLAVAKATVSGGGAPTVSTTNEFTFAPFKGFGIEAFDAGVEDETENPYTQAGGHPFVAKAFFVFNGKRSFNFFPGNPGYRLKQIDAVKTIRTDTPRGFVGNALAINERCPTMEDVFNNTCPPESLVGGLKLHLGEGALLEGMRIFAVEPEFGRPAQFAFTTPNKGIYVFYPTLRADDGYAITFESAPGPVNLGAPAAVDVTLCGFGANLGPTGGFASCRKATDANANPKPLITNPTRCVGDPPQVTLHANSWQNPDIFVSETVTDPMPTDCEAVPFEPTMEFKPTSKQADSPTGLDIELEMPTEGLESPTGISQSNLKKAKVIFPEGMGINAAAGHGLGACAADQVKLKTNDPISCPDSSKIGTIEIETPIIQETLKGAIYIAKQGEVDGALIGLYLVFESKKDGIIIKLPGTVKPDPVTGQLVSTFDESVEAPFSRVAIKFAQGPRSPLITPPKCGRYEITAEFTPWSVEDFENPDPADLVTDTSSFEVTEGPNGAPCPDGALKPKLQAGTTNPQAGAHTGFAMSISREDGSERINGLELSLPPGILGKLKGIPYCPDASIQNARDRSDAGEGVDEIASPSCPEASRLGSVSAGAGAGPSPLYVDTGKAYLAGPYKGAPLSLVVIAPAVAGPLDLGTVVVRNQLRIDRRTAQITAIADPVPTILHGVLLDLRDVRLRIDRPNFILNPTNCAEMSFSGQISGEKGSRAPVSERFQLAGCENLGFKPKLSIHLKGGTKRGDHPSLLAVLKARPGDANIARAAVTLPRSAFLDQAHIRTICTRVQFAGASCPPGAIYGNVEATTPLLEETLKGNVILRSSDNKLPDLVGTLNGIATVDVVGRIDSVRGGIRNTFDLVPDAPVDTFTLRMQGGKKGLVVNSQNLCAKVNRATVRFTAQNGLQYNYRPPVIADGCKKARKGAKGKKRSKRGGGEA